MGGMLRVRRRGVQAIRAAAQFALNTIVAMDARGCMALHHLYQLGGPADGG